MPGNIGKQALAQSEEPRAKRVRPKMQNEYRTTDSCNTRSPLGALNAVASAPATPQDASRAEECEDWRAPTPHLPHVHLLERALVHAVVDLFMQGNHAGQLTVSESR